MDHSLITKFGSFPRFKTEKAVNAKDFSCFNKTASYFLQNPASITKVSYY